MFLYGQGFWAHEVCSFSYLEEHAHGERNSNHSGYKASDGAGQVIKRTDEEVDPQGHLPPRGNETLNHKETMKSEVQFPLSVLR